MKQDDDDVLDMIAAVRLGRRDAFEGIVRRYERRLRAFCSMMLRSESLGEDAAQETFVKAYQSLDRFRGDSSFTSWIFALARNHCIDRIRASRPSTMISLDDPESRDEPSDPVDSPDRVEMRDTLDHLLRRLSASERKILLLRELYGFSYEELGELLGLSLDGVKGRVKRARIRSEEILRHFLGRADVGDKKRGNDL